MRKILGKTIIYPTIFFTGILLIIALNTVSQAEKVLSHFMQLPLVWVLPGVVLFTLAFMAIYCKWKRLKYFNCIALLIFLGIIALQLLVIHIAKIYPITDCFTTMDEAMAMVEKQNGILDNTTEYFSSYTNNYLFTIVMYYIFKMAKMMGVDYYNMAIFVNMILLDVGIYLSFCIMRKLWGSRRAAAGLLLIALCPTNYVFLHYVYTNTFSVPVVMGILYCGISIDKEKKSISKFMWAVLFCALSVYGTYLRPTTVFCTIGVILYFFRIKTLREKWKKILLLCIITSFLMLVLGKIIDNHLQNPNNTQGFPMTHWIMVGLNGTGEITGKDVKLTRKQDGKTEKIKFNMQEIEKRIKKLGVTGIAKLYVSKMGKEWAVGTDDYQVLQSSDRYYSEGYEWIYGNKRGMAVIYSQIYRCVCLLGIIIMLMQLRKKKRTDFRFVLVTAFLAMIVFGLLWETNKKHTICYTWMLIIMAESGFYRIWLANQYILKRKQEYILLKQWIGIGVLTLVLILCGILFRYSTISREKRLFYKEENNMPYIQDVAKNKRILNNVFYAQCKFNCIKVHAVPIKGANQNTEYEITLLDKKQTILESKVINAKIVRKSSWVPLLEGKILPKGKYYVRVSGHGLQDTIKFPYFCGKVFKPYEESVLVEGGDSMASLSLRVSCKY